MDFFSIVNPFFPKSYPMWSVQRTNTGRKLVKINSRTASHIWRPKIVYLFNAFRVAWEHGNDNQLQWIDWVIAAARLRSLLTPTKRNLRARTRRSGDETFSPKQQKKIEETCKAREIAKLQQKSNMNHPATTTWWIGKKNCTYTNCYKPSRRCDCVGVPNINSYRDSKIYARCFAITVQAPFSCFPFPSFFAQHASLCCFNTETGFLNVQTRASGENFFDVGTKAIKW